jgi:hypothetical protein
MIHFWVKLLSFILTGYFVSVGNWESAALFFMVYLGELCGSICESIENKEL